MLQKISSLKCAYCHDQFQFFSGTRRCSKCRAIFHDACWYEQKVCATYGCGGITSLEDSRDNKAGLLIGIVYIVGIVGLFRLGSVYNSKPLDSAALFLLGTAFTFSYFRPERSFLFRALNYFSQKVTIEDRPPWFPLFYAGMNYFLAIMFLIT